jgi:hypothetical protein
MSERLQTTPERDNDSLKNPEKHEVHTKIIEQGKNTRHEHAENIDSIRKKTETIARSTNESLIQNEKQDKEVESTLHINKELEIMAYQRTLNRTRKNLSKPSRAFSKIVHQPTIESVSEFTGKTIARPSGVLVGGIAAFIGSSLFLWISRYYGYEYNFLLFALFFTGGFFVGLLLEVGYKLLRRR